LMTGKSVDDIRSSADGQHLSIHNPDTKTWQKFDEHDSVFQDALNEGYSTAVAGWYNPYCRILPEVLNRCFWAFDALTPNKLLPDAATLRANMLEPLLYVVGNALRYPLLPFSRKFRMHTYVNRSCISLIIKLSWTRQTRNLMIVT
jgi:hypothetical protein